MTTRCMIVAACAALAACSSSNEPAKNASLVACNVGVELMRPYAGQTYSDAVGDELKRRSRSSVLRVVRPGDTMTKDFRADRLTLRLDEQGRMTGLNCG